MTTASTAHPDHQHIALRNDPKKVAVASMIGTAIEFCNAPSPVENATKTRVSTIWYYADS